MYYTKPRAIIKIILKHISLLTYFVNIFASVLYAIIYLINNNNLSL